MSNALVFATNNANKIIEIKKVLGNTFDIITLAEAGITVDIPEPYDTLEENARTKSTTIFKLTGRNCFSEDTGLFTEALNGEPGVKSARYAGEEANNQKNIAKLLTHLSGQPNRKAKFRTVISLIENGAEQQFEGICEGEIITALRGTQGFGYDAVFIPAGAKKTFAEMETDEKNKYSHRKKAVAMLVSYLHAKQ